MGCGEVPAPRGAGEQGGRGKRRNPQQSGVPFLQKARWGAQATLEAQCDFRDVHCEDASPHPTVEEPQGLPQASPPQRAGGSAAAPGAARPTTTLPGHGETGKTGPRRCEASRALRPAGSAGQLRSAPRAAAERTPAPSAAPPARPQGAQSRPRRGGWAASTTGPGLRGEEARGPGSRGRSSAGRRGKATCAN